MSNKEPKPWGQMNRVAEMVVERLRPATHRIEIAGSLRRHKPMVSDIEIVAIPRLDTNLLGEPLEVGDVDRLLAGWPIELTKNGPKYKQFSFAGSTGQTYTVDLFLQPDPRTWAVNFMIRTGSAEFSKRMLTPQAGGGYKPLGYEVRDGLVWKHGTPLELTTEEQIFTLWGMDYVFPEDRI